MKWWVQEAVGAWHKEAKLREGKGVSKLVCGLTACFVFLDPVPSVPMEQQHQKSIVPPSPVGDVRPATHLAPLEKPCEVGASGESCLLLSGIIFPVGGMDLLFLDLA